MEHARKAAQYIGKAVRLLENIVGIGGMLVFGLFIMYEIIARALGFPGLSWLQEFSQYMFIISIFIFCSRAVSSGDHLNMDMLYRITPAQFHKPLQCFVDLLMIAVSGFMLYCTWQYYLFLARMGTSTESMSAVKMTVVWLPILICIGTMTVRFLLVFIKRVKEYITFLQETNNALDAAK